VTLFEQEVRDYLRNDDVLMALLNGDVSRVNMDWSGNVSASHVVLYRAGGQRDGYRPLDTPVIVVHCYGSTRPAAATLASAVAASLQNMDSRATPLLDCNVESINYLPTTEGVARYVVTTSVTALIGAEA
jgi:hypothetical protein